MTTAEIGLPAADQLERDIAALLGLDARAGQRVTRLGRGRGRWAFMAALVITVPIGIGVVGRDVAKPVPSKAAPDQAEGDRLRARPAAGSHQFTSIDHAPAGGDHARDAPMSGVAPAVTTPEIVPVRVVSVATADQHSPLLPTSGRPASVRSVHDIVATGVAHPRSVVKAVGEPWLTHGPSAPALVSSGNVKQPLAAAVPLAAFAALVPPPQQPTITSGSAPVPLAAAERDKKRAMRQQINALDALRLLRRQ